MFAFPKTPHLMGSIVPSDTEVVLTKSETALVLAQDLVVEEKLDGSNLGIMFHEGSMELLVRAAHDVLAGEHQNLQELRRFINRTAEVFRHVLGEQFIIFGEWLYLTHSISYGSLPSYYMPFDVLDRGTLQFVSTLARYSVFAKIGLPSPPVLFSGTKPDLDELSHRVSDFGEEPIEGLIVRTVRATQYGDRFKYIVRSVDEAMKNLWTPREFATNQLLG